MFTISLDKVRVFAPLGLYPEELLTGNEFEADAAVWTDKDPSECFVDYVLLNRLIQDGFSAGHPTLEAICMHIQQQIRSHFPFASRIKICIRKMHPPMQGSVGCAQVCLES